MNFNFARFVNWKRKGTIAGILIPSVIVLSLVFINAGGSDAPPAGSVLVGQGGNSDVYQLGQTAYKIVRGGTESRNQLVDLVNDVAGELPGIVPAMEAVGNNTATQSFVSGLKFEELTPAAQNYALNTSIPTLAIHAGEMLGEKWTGKPISYGTSFALDNGNIGMIDPAVQNFRFYQNGEVRFWFDPIFIGDASNASVRSLPPPQIPAVGPTPQTLLAQRPSVITGVNLVGRMAGLVGIPVYMGDYIAGVSTAANKPLYTAQYLTSFIIGFGALKSGQILGTMALRYVAGAAVAAVVAPWVGTGAMIAFTGYGIYHLYKTLYPNQGPFLPGGSLGQEVNIPRLASLAGGMNGCRGSCTAKTEPADLYAQGVEIRNIQDYAHLTNAQFASLQHQIQQWHTGTNYWLSQLQSDAAAGLKIPDTTQLSQLSNDIDGIGTQNMNANPRVPDNSSSAQQSPYSNSSAPIAFNPVTYTLYAPTAGDPTLTGANLPVTSAGQTSSSWLIRTSQGTAPDGSNLYLHYYPDGHVEYGVSGPGPTGGSAGSDQSYGSDGSDGSGSGEPHYGQQK